MVVAIAVTVVRIADAAENSQPPAIDLQMRNDFGVPAGVPAGVLEQSQDEVTRIFAAAGLAVRWTETAPRITVAIVPQALGFDRAASHVMGVALPGVKGSTARVFFKQVQDFARTYHADLGKVLAHVIVHELGHLLLPANAHSPTGVMQANWDNALARNVVKGSLTFTEAQAEKIRALRRSPG